CSRRSRQTASRCPKGPTCPSENGCPTRPPRRREPAGAGAGTMTTTANLDVRLDEVARQYDELNAELALPETSTDVEALKRLGREVARLEPVVEAYRELRRTRDELAG